MKINQYFITNDDSISINDVDFSVNSIDKFKVYNHKNLKANVFESESNALIILGDVFNPYYPNYSNKDIGCELLKSKSLNSLLKQVDKFTGRFVMFVKINGAYYVLSDFFTQRHVYYLFKEDEFYASSSDKLLLDCLNLKLEIDDEKASLMTSNYFLKINEHWFLNETDWDNRLKKLLPNHYLDIVEAETKRIPVFVTKTSEKKQLEAEVLSALKGSVEAYSKRYKLMLGLTSGYDSRLLLAASFSLKHVIKYFTFSRNDTYVQRDVKVAKQLSKAYHLDYQSIKTTELSPEFISEYKKQFLVPRLLDKTKNIQWFWNKKLSNTIVVNGFGGELFRRFYKTKTFSNSISICEEIEYEPTELNINALDTWLKSAMDYSTENKLLISDLFYLEIRLGKWGSKMVHEMDLSGVEEFTPYNNRYLMYSLLLNYNEEDRKTITLNLLEQSLQGVTKIPFNPKTWKDTVKRIIFYEHYKKLVQKIK